MSYDLTFLEIDGEQSVLRTHAEDQCAGRPCCIHTPSGHHMASWPMRWDYTVYRMERMCPHGQGHPDPDHLAYVGTIGGGHTCSPGHQHLDDIQAWHECDGCCKVPE